jgi:hypothetical protein
VSGSGEPLQAHVRIAGHRVALVPRAPFVLCRHEDGVRVTHGAFLANVRVVGESLRYIVDGGARGLHDLMVAVDTDYRGDFRLETSHFLCAWPVGFHLASPDRDGPFLFDLVPEAGEGEPGFGCLIFVAGPYTQELCPSVDALIGDGQVEVGRAVADNQGIVEVAYEHRGAPHRQQHTRFEAGGHVFVLTVQGPEATFEGARTAANEMATSLRVA